MGIIVTLAELQLPLSAHTQRVNIALNLQRRMRLWSHYFFIINYYFYIPRQYLFGDRGNLLFRLIIKHNYFLFIYKL